MNSRSSSWCATIATSRAATSGTPSGSELSPQASNPAASTIAARIRDIYCYKARVAQLFDHHAASYEADLAHALAPSGEDREFFARGRVAWLGRCLREIGAPPRTVLDFGCGAGCT